MMEVMLICFGWLVCAAIGFMLMCYYWRMDLDVTVADVWFFGFYTVLLGPASIIAMLVILAITVFAKWSDKRDYDRKVVWRRRQ